VFAWHGLGGSSQLTRLYFGVEQEAGGAAIFVFPDGLEVPSYGGIGWVLDAGGRDVLPFDALLAQAATSGPTLPPPGSGASSRPCRSPHTAG